MTGITTSARDKASGIFLVIALLMAILAPRSLAFVPLLIGTLGYASTAFTIKRLMPFSKTFVFLTVPILILAAASAVWAANPETVFMRVKKLLIVSSGGLLIISAAQIAPSDWIKKRLYFLWFGVFIGGSLCAAILFSKGALYKPLDQILGSSLHENWRVASVNRPAIVFLMCLFPVIHLIRHHVPARSYKSFLIGSLIFVTALITFKTDSQSFQLALLIMTLVYMVFPVRQTWCWLIVGAFITAGILSGPFIASWLFDVLPALGKNVYLFEQSYAADRLEIWDFISRRALEKPFLGHGIEAARTIKDFNSAQLYHADTHVLHPHNFVIQIWLEFGALGAVLITAIIMTTLSILRALPEKSAQLGLSVVSGCLSVAATGYGFWQSWWLGLLFTAAALCILVHRADQDRQTA